MAKDTEKLIRQLSLISFLMAHGRPVSALEIRREVEGYTDMNEDAFARRFYADRAELESLGINLQVDRPGEGFFEAELYSLPPENFYLPPVEFEKDELAALHTTLSLLTREQFAYAEPLQLALQQVAWGQPNPILGEVPAPVEVAATASARGRELSQRLSKIETAISRRKTIEFSYYTMERDETAKRKVDPYHLVFRDGQFYLIAYSHEREDVRIFRLSRIRDKVGYSTKAEHDFAPPEDFDRREYARRATWQLGPPQATAKVYVGERIAWLVERDHGRYGTVRDIEPEDGAPSPEGKIFETEYSDQRALIAWALHWREQAQVLAPDDLREETAKRVSMLRARHANGFRPAEPVPAADPPVEEPRRSRSGGRDDTVIRPERFARLVTIAGLLIESAQSGERLSFSGLCKQFGLSEGELTEDIEVLNVVNFGGGTYVLYAEINGDEIEVDTQPYGENFARPARLLPLEAKALIAAIDLFGDHLPKSGLRGAREKIVEALGHDPSEEGLEIAPGSGNDVEAAKTVNEAIAARQVLEIDYYKANEDEFTQRRIEPYRLQNGAEGWYVKTYDLEREDIRHFKLDRIREATPTGVEYEPRAEMDRATGVEDWMIDGTVPASNVARVWVSPERARWMREERDVVSELDDGSVVVEVAYAGIPFLVREVLRGAGDYVVIEPTDAREAVARELGV